MIFKSFFFISRVYRLALNLIPFIQKPDWLPQYSAIVRSFFEFPKNMLSSLFNKKELKVKDKQILQIAWNLKSQNNIIKELKICLIKITKVIEFVASLIHVVHKKYKESLSKVDCLYKQLVQVVKQIKDASV